MLGFLIVSSVDGVVETFSITTSLFGDEHREGRKPTTEDNIGVKRLRTKKVVFSGIDIARKSEYGHELIWMALGQNYTHQHARHPDLYTQFCLKVCGSSLVG